MSIGRRGLLGGGALVLAGSALAGCGKEAEAGQAAPTAGSVPAGSVKPTGTQQAGITRPSLPPPHLLSVVLDLTGAPGPILAGLGTLILDLTGRSLDGVVAPEDLTVTVGIGPRLVTMAGADLPGTEELPRYRREEIAERDRGGDLWLQIGGSNPVACSMAASTLLAGLGEAAAVRWTQEGFRGRYEKTPDGHQAGRNLMGFTDGIVAPRSTEELDEGVWISSPPPAADATIAVLRRFRFDLAGWNALDTAAQAAAVGRDKATARPLSGGTQIDLGAKTPDGHYRVAADAHARRAHALDVGVPLMLRRAYSIAVPGPGLLFISFQSTLRAFTATMARLDESDRMLDFTVATAAATFLVLPGFDQRHPLGSTLFG